MSHLPQRLEKNCLNCGTTVIGKYCHECGQENSEPKESVWQLLSHFFSDVTHFDGKFFTSLKDLITRPGYLSRQYTLGRRASFLNPVRMYLFTSFIFFLIFFSFFKWDQSNLTVVDRNNAEKVDTADMREISSAITSDGKPLTKADFSKKMTIDSVHFINQDYTSKAAYDSALASGKVTDNWFLREATYRGIELTQKYGHNKKRFIADFIEKLQHSIPQMLFVLLPLFALILKILYVRHKDYYYTEHAIFTLHFYIFSFIMMLLIFAIAKLDALPGLAWMTFINVALTMGILFYLYKAMRVFYRQSRVKTLGKMSLLLLTFFISGLFLFVIFAFISIFEI